MYLHMAAEATNHHVARFNQQIIILQFFYTCFDFIM